MSSAVDPAPKRRRLPTRLALGGGLAVAGVIAMVALVERAGVAAVGDTLGRATRWIPLLILLEGIRILCDAGATLAIARRSEASASAGRRLPPATVARAQLAAYPVATFTPAGRAASEAVKAVLFTPWLGGASAAAVATVSQSLSLAATSAVSAAAAVATWTMLGAAPITAAIAAHAVVSLGAAVFVRWAGRSVGASWLGRRIGILASGYRERLAELPGVPSLPLALFTLQRALLVVEYALLLAASGIATGAGPALVASGVYALGAAAGELVPAQLGATDSAFALAAPVLGASLPAAMSVALLAHLLQGAWAVFGAVAVLLWGGRPPGATAIAGEERARAARAPGGS